MPREHFAICEATVRKADYDRYLAALFAPPMLRPHLFALYAFNYEVAKTAETVSQPMAGQIRLQWWREAVDGIYAGKAREHPVVQALTETVQAHALPRDLFEALIEAREGDLEDGPFAAVQNLETYADATSGHVMRLAARILGTGDALDARARAAGIAYALAGLLRALPYHAAQRRLMLPVSELQAAGLTLETLFAGGMSPAVTVLVARIADIARRHLDEARAISTPRRFLPALLPAALVPVYLNLLTRPGFHPFRDVVEVPIYRRQLAMLGAMLKGHI